MRNIILVVVLCIAFSTIGCTINHRKPCHANNGPCEYCHTSTFIKKHDLGLSYCAKNQIRLNKMWDDYAAKKK